MTVTLQEAARQHARVWCFCLVCGHGGRLDAYQLAQLIGRNARLEEVAERLRCSRCQARLGHCVLEPRRALDRDDRR